MKTPHSMITSIITVDDDISAIYTDIFALISNTYRPTGIIMTAWPNTVFAEH